MIVSRSAVIFTLAAAVAVLAAVPASPAGAASHHPSTAYVSAGRPHMALVGRLGHPGVVDTLGEADTISRAALAPGEGAGAGWCGQYGGYDLGAHFRDVYACGPSTGAADDFDSVGFQCVELSARYLWVVYGKFASDVDTGADFVRIAHQQLGIPVGRPGPGSVPKRGDIVSLWGDPGTSPDGHTAVVTGVKVNSSGNGSVKIMEENASANGWDQISVSDWSESYGGPGYYDFNHVSWLKLNTIGGPPALSSASYHVHPLGLRTVATGINNAGVVTGLMHTGGEPATVPFVYADKRLSVVSTPSSAGKPSGAVGINQSGILALSTDPPGGRTGAYAVTTSGGTKWQALALDLRGLTAAAANSIDGIGDIAGWASNRADHSPTVGVVWFHYGRGFMPVTLSADRSYSAPVAFASDRSGDAAGQESLGNETYPVIWFNSGAPWRLSGLKAADGSGSVRALWDATAPTFRTLVAVGSSRSAVGADRAVLWQMRVSGARVAMRTIQSLGVLSGFASSGATAVNSSGWVVGHLITPRGTWRAFLWQPANGMRTLNSLLPRKSGWVILNARGINSHGQIVANGYRKTKTGRGPNEGLLLDPTKPLGKPVA